MSTINIAPVNDEKNSIRKFNVRTSFKKVMYISFATIPLSILLFYGIEDDTSWFFGHDYINDYRYRIDGVVYNIGIMVGHFALIVTLSVIGLLIAWIMYETLKVSNILNIAKVRDHGNF